MGQIATSQLHVVTINVWKYLLNSLLSFQRHLIFNTKDNVMCYMWCKLSIGCLARYNWKPGSLYYLVRDNLRVEIRGPILTLVLLQHPYSALVQSSSHQIWIYAHLSKLEFRASESGGEKCCQVAGELWRIHRVFKARDRLRLFVVACVATPDLFEGLPSKY